VLCLIKSWNDFRERDLVAPQAKIYSPLASLPAFGGLKKELKSHVEIVWPVF
jgi:hypothetical protein